MSNDVRGCRGERKEQLSSFCTERKDTLTRHRQLPRSEGISTARKGSAFSLFTKRASSTFFVSRSARPSDTRLTCAASLSTEPCRNSGLSRKWCRGIESAGMAPITVTLAEAFSLKMSSSTAVTGTYCGPYL